MTYTDTSFVFHFFFIDFINTFVWGKCENAFSIWYNNCRRELSANGKATYKEFRIKYSSLNTEKEKKIINIFRKKTKKKNQKSLFTIWCDKRLK